MRASGTDRPIQRCCVDSCDEAERRSHVCDARTPSRPATKAVLERATALEVLAEGEIEVVGRIIGSSNNALLVTVTQTCPEPVGERALHAVYKPTIGERPLDDFPDGTLTRREVAAWLVSEASGWGIVPPTILREGPFGEGMLQAFVEADDDVDVVAMVVEDDPRLRRMAAFDAAVNNTDRKGGHILPVDGGRPHPRRRPRRVLLVGPEAADRAVGLARRTDGRRRTDGPRAASARHWTRTWVSPSTPC